MMDNSQILAVVVIIAVVAVVGRVLINRQQKGGINWGKIGAIAFVAVAFLVAFMAVDSYRIGKWMAGTAEVDNVKGSRDVGRRAGNTIARVESFDSGVVPYLFTAEVETLEHTGYWKLKYQDRSNPFGDRQEMVSQSDDSRTAIKHTITTFNITRLPDDESKYIGIYKVTLTSGERLLATLDPKDAEAGLLPVSTTHVLEGKMESIARQDSLLLQSVYIDSFDSQTYGSQPPSYLIYKVIAGLLAGLVALALCSPVIKRLKK